MLKTITATLVIFFHFISVQSQYLWYENETNTNNIQLQESSNGTFFTDQINPIATGINNNSTASKFIRNANVTKGFTFFKLFKSIEIPTLYSVSFKAYIDVSTEDLLTTPNRIRVYLKNTSNNELIQKQLVFTSGREWSNFTFEIDSSDFTQEGLADGGYDQMYIGYGNGQESTTEITYYIDSINGATEYLPPALNPNIEWLQGSWGARLYVRAGETLDDYVDNRGYDYVAGAQEIVDSYSTIGHVITNATNNANSHLYTLRNNPNVDEVMGAPNSIISEEFVPSIDNEQIIIDVIRVFKEAGKKVILYLNTLSPAARSSEEGAVAWNAYVDQYFNGNEHLAWTNLCEGYVKRFAELGVDGYWLDAFSSYPGNDIEKEAFIQMFRDVDPNLAISANLNKTYFTDENNEFIYVDSDGVNDEDETSYRVIKLAGNDPHSDFTPGHITPLAQGAPPNSWAYEEFTIADVKESPVSSNGESKLVLKHLFSPIRATWSSERTELMFDGQQAYRFVKNITDAGGAITFSNTTDTDGTTMEDEEAVLKYVNQQMLANVAASEYVRPEGAFLVSENVLSIDDIKIDENDFNIIPNPVTDEFQVPNKFRPIAVYNILGQKVIEFEGNHTSYNISELKEGVYLLKVYNPKNQAQLIRFVKN